jgi:hypothetical protein
VRGSLKASTLRGLYGKQHSRREANGALLGGLLCTYRVKTKDSGGGTRPSRFPEKKEHAADFRLMSTGLKSVFGEN